MTNEPKDWAKFKAENEENEQTIDANKEDDSTQHDPNSKEREPTIRGALEHPDYEALEEKLFETEQRVQENWDAAIRAKAELENVRRQAERDVERAHKFGTSKLIESLLPVIDSLEQALQLAIENEDTAMQEGLELTMKVFLDALEKQGVVQIDPVGEVFNPERHEAISMQPSKDAEPNTVLNVFQKGYELNGRVIRAARVIVSSK
ncbi:nucleotide exchange factor GrpE [Legionella sp. W05-934-2]|jgi:molecular chaperone GrpE|uniref:nucleotide exchange factor GrpE n=1 Tax=Legionella sp. W05-934-2 TaxID=1198649 RepID=UPI003461FA98